MMALDKGDQYTQLCNDGRHIDNRMWIILATAYPISFYGLKVAHDAADDTVVSVVVSALVVAVFFGLLGIIRDSHLLFRWDLWIRASSVISD